MHHEGLRFGLGEESLRGTETTMVLVDGGEKPLLLPFPLDAEKVDDIRSPDGRHGIGLVADSEGLRLDGHERRGAGKDDFGPQFSETDNVAAHDTAVKDIADDSHFGPVQLAQSPSGRVKIEERLGGMG